MTQPQLMILTGVTPDTIPFDTLLKANQPVLMPGLVRNWPLVQKASQTPTGLMNELLEHHPPQPLLCYRGAPDIKARFGYNETATGFNFDSQRTSLSEVFDHISHQLDDAEHDYLYINSLKLAESFPSLAPSHHLNFSHPVFEQNQPVAKIWLGTESVAAAHFDQPDNIACCVAGRRRFTLFAPEHIHHLYPGPLHPTPGGQVVTMANLQKPDFDRFPKLANALEAAVVVDMEPGDALYYPSMWWHEVQAQDRFNIMINFWWMTANAMRGNPMDVLLHGMLSLRQRPAQEKQAWRELFDYYVFGDASEARAHLPEASQGPLGEMDGPNARRLRAMLLQSLNR